MAADPAEIRYRAFVSYSHQDSEVAAFWHGRLQTFPIHPPFQGMPTPHGLVPATLAPIFRDRVHFTAGDELTAATQRHLDESAALVLLASPASAASKWVNGEVLYFRHTYPKRPIIPVLIGPNDAEFRAMLPPALAFHLDADGAITDQPFNPTAVDPRPGKDGEVVGIARIVGRLVGFEGHLLRQFVEDVERRDRASRAAADAAAERDRQLLDGQARHDGKLDGLAAGVAELLALARAGGVIDRAAERGIPEPAIRAIVERLGGQGIARVDLIPSLDNWIEHARTELDRHSNEGTGYDAAWRKAEALFNAGRMAEVADPFIQALRNLEVHTPEAYVERQRQRVALLEAAIHFDARALSISTIPPKLRMLAAEFGISGADALGQFLCSRADERYRYGRDKGDNTALLVSIAAWQAALEERTRDRVPLDWATTQNSLGNALQTLGERESGTSRLEQAVIAHRAALQEYTDAPRDWAMTQNNLGNALWRIGERESGTARLQEAVTAFRAALNERHRAPRDRAMTQNNLGNALATIGERESGTARLEEAVTAYRTAVEEYGLDPEPLGLAMTQNNLGGVLATLGERESGTPELAVVGRKRLEEALTAYHAALEKRTRKRVPLDWAATQNNLGIALQTLGKLESGTGRLKDAIAAYQAALEEFTRDRVPLDWAQTQHHLATTLALLAERQRDRALLQLQQAIAHMRGATEVYRDAHNTYSLPAAEQQLKQMEATLAAWPP